MSRLSHILTKHRLKNISRLQFLLPLIPSVALLSADKLEASPGNTCLLIRLKTYVKKDALILTTITTNMDKMVHSW